MALRSAPYAAKVRHVNARQVHFLTFTGNPLAETTFFYSSWATGKTQRARECSFQMGGKGINVSKMLIRLGARTTALSFLGGHSGAQCADWLSSRCLPFIPIPTQAPTRQGLVVRAPEAPETTFLGMDAPADAGAWLEAAACLARFRQSEGTSRGAALAFCGSCPGWDGLTAAPFRVEIDAWLADGLPLFVDTYGPPLSWFCDKAVDLVKINADELRALLGNGAPVDQLLEQALVKFPVQTWIVSDGPGPVWYASRGEKPRFQTPPVIHEVSATGSGDVLLACLLHARLSLGADWDAALRFAMPMAAANAAHPGIAEFPDLQQPPPRL